MKTKRAKRKLHEHVSFMSEQFGMLEEGLSIIAKQKATWRITERGPVGATVIDFEKVEAL